MQYRYRTLALLLAIAAAPAFAERPMMVDDAGTLDKGGRKVEFGWSEDGRTSGVDGVFGFAPVDDLELEVGLDSLRDRTDPATKVKLAGTGFALKWVPLKAETGLSAGLKLEFGRVRSSDGINPTTTDRERSLNGLFTWGFATGQLVHFNVGRAWTKPAGATDATGVNTWGLGFDQPVGEKLSLLLETYGEQHSNPDRQVGLRWKVAEGLKLSIAGGRSNGRGYGNTGLAWEF